MYVSKRGIGRTTRMVRLAVSTAKAGRPIMIVAANQREADRINLLVQEESVRQNADITGLVEIRRIMDRRFMADQMRFVGWDYDIVIDHFAIEFMYSRILNELYRYDQ